MVQKKQKYTYNWPRPMVSVDAAVFTFHRNRPKILLIKRGNEPFKGHWALPGGFVGIDEELEDAIARELFEETGLTNVQLRQLHTFGKCGRDPRGRQITIAFLGYAEDAANKIRAGDDAAEAAWFDIERLPQELAFDHNEIIPFAITRFKKTAFYRKHISR